MRTARLDDMTGGWFVGSFQPTAHHNADCEVAVKKYSAGDREPEHVHRIATEVTLILSGRVRMAGMEFAEGDIVILDPGDATDFTSLTDSITVVVKTPSVSGDKYLTSAGNTSI